MKIGIDISQTAYKNTGVANFLKNLVENLILYDRENEYVLFYSSLRRKLPGSKLWSEGGNILYENCPKGVAITINQFKIPPTILNVLWNKLHIFPIEKFIGDVDVFISSDWTQPPTKKAKKATILYDLIVYKFPKETAKKIIKVQKERLKWVKKEADIIFCISEATKKDATEILCMEEERLKVIYPGI